LYLENLDRVFGKTRISGQLRNWHVEKGNFNNIKVLIRQQDKTWEVRTNEKGVFEIYDLPPGEYLVEPEIPNGWRINFYTLRNIPFGPDSLIRQIPVTLLPHGHRSLEITFVVDNAIRGHVVGSTGEFRKACLLAGNLDSKGYGIDCSKENGEFEIKRLSPGDYILEADIEGDYKKHESSGKIYHPGVPDKKHAEVFTMAPGVFIKDVTMRIPEIAERVEISGTLRYADDRLVENAHVFLQFKPTDYPDQPIFSEWINDAKFKLRVLKGISGTLSAFMTTYPGDFQNCPAIEELIKNSGKHFADLNAKELKLSAMEDALNLQLSFPFPYCEKTPRQH
jgi:hypothetical protein